MQIKRPLVTIIAWCLACVCSRATEAQNSSLLHATSQRSITAQAMPGNQASQMRQQSVGVLRPPSDPTAAEPGQFESDARPPITLNGASWTHQQAPPLRTFAINDFVNIRVDEITRMMAQGTANTRKSTLYETVLSDWIRLTDFRLRPDPQGNGDPTISASADTNYRAQSLLESRESMTFNIAARVVDIRPNGSLVLEARKKIRVNDNLWETSLVGVCRAEDIAPDNTVLSKDLIDLEIHKEDQGHLRDSYKRGWLQRWIDRLQPF